MPYKIEIVTTKTYPRDDMGFIHQEAVNAKTMMLEAMGYEVCHCEFALTSPNPSLVYLVTQICYETK